MHCGAALRAANAGGGRPVAREGDWAKKHVQQAPYRGVCMTTGGTLKVPNRRPAVSASGCVGKRGISSAAATASTNSPGPSGPTSCTSS